MVRDGVAPPESEKQALEGTGVSTFTAGQALTRAREVGGPITDRLAVEDRFEIYAWIFPRGPHGHRGSALSYNNQAIWSETQHPEESFQLASYLTGRDIAIWTPLDGALQAMARRSAWFSDELHERYPFKAQVAEWFDTHVDPFPNPHNFRFIEWQQIYENETFEYFNGNESFEDMQPRLQERCQAVLDAVERHGGPKVMYDIDGEVCAEGEGRPDQPRRPQQRKEGGFHSNFRLRRLCGVSSWRPRNS
jgi:ABC-type glycerol-3-phosphate transport system substrate-binding protein